MSGHDLFRFEQLQQLARALEDARRKSSQAPDLDPIGSVCASRQEPVQKEYFVARFTDLNVIVANRY
jgi:hypothetical protein